MTKEAHTPPRKARSRGAPSRKTRRQRKWLRVLVTIAGVLLLVLLGILGYAWVRTAGEIAYLSVRWTSVGSPNEGSAAKKR